MKHEDGIGRKYGFETGEVFASRFLILVKFYKSRDMKKLQKQFEELFKKFICEFIVHTKKFFSLFETWTPVNPVTKQ